MRNLIDGNRVFGEIMMYRPYSRKMCYIIVEGITDKRFYSKFVDSEKCKIIVGDSKNNVIEGIRIANKLNMIGIIGIVDKDFNGIINYANNIENLYETDDHDIETMIFKSRAFNDVIAEYIEEEKLDGFGAKTIKDLKNLILLNGAIIGCLRFHSLLNNIGLNFKDIKYEAFINMDTFGVDIDKFIYYILNNSENVNKTNKDIKKHLTKLIEKNYNPYDICCGHDLVSLLYLALKHKIGSYNTKNLSLGELEGNFRIAYNIEYFKETNLYNSLIMWEKENKSYKIFSAMEYLEAI